MGGVEYGHAQWTRLHKGYNKMRVSQPRGEVLFEMAMESEDRVSDAVRVIERGGGHPHHEAMAAVMARILASATPPGPGSASKIQERKRKGGGKRIEQNIKRKRRKMKVVKVAISLVLFSNFNMQMSFR